MFDTTWYNKELWQRHSGDALPSPPPDPAVAGAALLFWEEHCVECSIPECYSSCRLYVARRDQKCARFVYGIAPNPTVTGLLPYGADVRFRRWGKLEARLFGTPRLLPLSDLRRYDAWERRLEAVANATASALQPLSPKRRVNGLHTFLRNRWLGRTGITPTAESETPDAFYVKLFNPAGQTLALSIEFHQDRLVYRDQIPAEPGWNSMAIPVDQLNLRPGVPGRILVSPANDEEARFIFTWLDFVRLVPSGTGKAAKPAVKVKCVVWDLDNTLWRGVLGDDGADAVQLNPDARALIDLLDQRGIVQSIASKNTYDVAWPKIEALGLQDHFLYPAIHWGPKSGSVQHIADELNINVDTLAVIDDSAFERAEITARLPQVRVYDAVEIGTLLDRPEFDVPVTEASRARRLSYLAEAQRKQVAANWSTDLEGFLRSCDMHMRISRPVDAQKDRCIELIARTNQLNLSTRRLSETDLDALLGEPGTDVFALSCRDRFGDYGLVGFASIEWTGPDPTLRDFVLSCRVAQKRVEEAFVFWYAHRARAAGAERLRAILVATDRNQPLRDALQTLPFTVVEQHDRTTILEMPLAGSLPRPDLITIETGD